MARFHTIINAATGETREVPYSPDEELAADAAELAAANRVPEHVTNFQARAALMAGGHLAAVESYVATLGPLAQAAWEYAATVERDSALVEAVRVELGLSAGEMDELFRAAAEIAV